MNTDTIWSGIVVLENVNEMFKNLYKTLEGRTYTLTQKRKSSYKPKDHVNQKYTDLTLKKMIGYSLISIQDSVGTIILMRIPNLSKEDSPFPFVKISTNRILINNQNRTIVFVLDPY